MTNVRIATVLLALALAATSTLAPGPTHAQTGVAPAQNDGPKRSRTPPPDTRATEISAPTQQGGGQPAGSPPGFGPMQANPFLGARPLQSGGDK